MALQESEEAAARPASFANGNGAGKPTTAAPKEASTAPAQSATPPAATAMPAAQGAVTAIPNDIKATPVAAAIISDKKIDATSITPSGTGGRILKQDVLEALAHPGRTPGAALFTPKH